MLSVMRHTRCLRIDYWL